MKYYTEARKRQLFMRHEIQVSNFEIKSGLQAKADSFVSHFLPGTSFEIFITTANGSELSFGGDGNFQN